MTDRGDFSREGEHTHAQPVSFIVWALLVCVVVLALSLGGLAAYLTGRATLADRRNAVTEGQTLALRHAVCAVLNPIRPGQVRGVDQARALPFPAPRGMESLCSTLRTRKPSAARTPSATASGPAAAPVRPAPATVRTVMVTPTRSSNRPSPRPTPTGTLSPTPRPTPTPSRTCVAVICLR